MTIIVVNKYHTKVGEYIGRGSPLGNPFPINNATGDTRQVVINKYAAWLKEKIASCEPTVINEMNRLAGLAMQGDLKLQCFCKPQACHGDVIKEIIDEAITHNSKRR